MVDVGRAIFDWAGEGEHVVIRETDWEAISSLVRSLPDEHRQKFKDLKVDILPIQFTA